MPLPEGTVIRGRYVLAGLPKGGMAEVYKGADLRDGFRPVAVKVLTSVKLDQDILAETFRRETQALRELRHPGIVELIDAGTDDATGYSFLVLEWVESTLNEWVKKSPPSSWNSFYDTIGKDLLEALAFAHTHNVAHRDVKPGNVLMSKDNQVKLGDFGISKLTLSLQAGLTLREFRSPPFTPPEPDDGEFIFTRDVFGFGTIVLASLTDVRLADYPDIAKALAKFDAPKNVRDLIAQAVAFDPADAAAGLDPVGHRAGGSGPPHAGLRRTDPAGGAGRGAAQR
jgi:serine/threonine protein kinase